MFKLFLRPNFKNITTSKADAIKRYKKPFKGILLKTGGNM